MSRLNYDPFGMLLEGRSWSVSYRYGFNGKEMDPETYGQGNVYDYGFRIYNPRLGKFLSVDPLFKNYPFNSTYAFAQNRVIDGVDLDGLEYEYYMVKWKYIDGKLHLTLEYYNTINTIPWTFDTWLGEKTLDFPLPSKFYVATIGYYNYFFTTKEEMENAVKEFQSEFVQEEFDECHCMFTLPEEKTLEYWERQAEGIINFTDLLGTVMSGTMMRMVTIKAPLPMKISNKRMANETKHFNKHGRNMGYASKKDYRNGAKEFAEKNQTNPNAKITDGTYQGKGTKNGQQQRIIQNEGKTVIISKEDGQVIDFYETVDDGIGQNFKIEKVWE